MIYSVLKLQATYVAILGRVLATLLPNGLVYESPAEIFFKQCMDKKI